MPLQYKSTGVVDTPKSQIRSYGLYMQAWEREKTPGSDEPRHSLLCCGRPAGDKPVHAVGKAERSVPDTKRPLPKLLIPVVHPIKKTILRAHKASNGSSMLYRRWPNDARSYSRLRGAPSSIPTSRSDPGKQSSKTASFANENSNHQCQFRVSRSDDHT